jgi:hypothetical protein
MSISVSTIANAGEDRPDATKYGGKIVVCQPGMTDVAKSKLTMVCTETTSGVASPGQEQVGRLVAPPGAVRAVPAEAEEVVDLRRNRVGRAVAHGRQVGQQADVPEDERDE